MKRFWLPIGALALATVSNTGCKKKVVLAQPPPVITAPPANRTPTPPPPNVPPPPKVESAKTTPPPPTTAPIEPPAQPEPPKPPRRAGRKPAAKSPARGPATETAQQTPPPTTEPMTSSSSVPQLTQLLSPAEQAAYNRAIDVALEGTRANLSRLTGKRLSSSQRATFERAGAFAKQAEETRATDLATSKTLAERAQLLSDDLVKGMQ